MTVMTEDNRSREEIQAENIRLHDAIDREQEENNKLLRRLNTIRGAVDGMTPEEREKRRKEVAHAHTAREYNLQTKETKLEIISDVINGKFVGTRYCPREFNINLRNYMEIAEEGGSVRFIATGRFRRESGKGKE